MLASTPTLRSMMTCLQALPSQVMAGGDVLTMACCIPLETTHWAESSLVGSTVSVHSTSKSTPVKGTVES